VLLWIARTLSPDVYISLMSQYFPAHKALKHPLLSRRLTEDEYIEALEAFDEAGFEEGWRQDEGMDDS
jgi:putative pyruvate formate lyase activating enzyme